MIRVLHILSALDCGGVERMLKNYYDRFDHSQIVFDFIVHGSKTGILEESFKRCGSKIYHITPKRESFFRNLRDINKVICDNQYDIIHCHQNEKSFLALWLAKRNKVKIRICHSHNAMQPETKLHNLLHRAGSFMVCRVATDFLACSKEAAEWTYGKMAADATIIKNAMETKWYIFDPAKRDVLRKEIGISGKFVIGNIGRLHFQKNQKFLLEIFRCLLKKIPEAVLLIVGDGELRDELKQKSEELGMSEKIKFLGARSDVGDLYSAMDMFLFPSLFEGLGMVVVEAQISGLKCFISDKVPGDAVITGNTGVIPLSKSAEEWSDAVYSWYRNYDSERFEAESCAAEHGYDINTEYKKLENFYLEGINDSKRKVRVNN